MLEPMAELLQTITPAQPEAVNIDVSELHKLVLFELITGAVGMLPILITTTLLTALTPQLLLHVAV